MLFYFGVLFAVTAYSSEMDVYRQYFCPDAPKCQPENCPKLPEDCEAVSQDLCSCCKVCGRKEGEYCGLRAPCEKNLECRPNFGSDSYVSERSICVRGKEKE